MSPLLRGWMIAGAAAGFLAVLAVAIFAVVDEVYVGCDTGRCHDLSYAVWMVLGPLLAYGACAALVGGLAGLALGTSILWLRKPSLAQTRM